MSSHLERARMLMDVRRHRDAAPLILEHLAIEPNSAHAHAMLAWCYLELKQIADAQQQIQEAIHLAPDDAFGHYVHSFILRELKSLRKARRQIREALRLNPDDADYRAQSAELFTLEGQYEHAIVEANCGLELNPTHLDCTCILAFALLCLREYKEADQVMQRVLTEHPDQAEVHATIGWAAARCHRYQLAQRHFLNALQIDPNNGWAAAGLIESRHHNFLCRGMESVETAVANSAIGLPALVMFTLWYGIFMWNPPWFGTSLQPPLPAIFRLYFTGCALGLSMLGFIALSGKSLATIGLLTQPAIRRMLTSEEIGWCLSGWFLLLTGSALMGFGSYSLDRTIYLIGYLHVWGAILVANLGRPQSTRCRWLCLILLAAYVFSAIGCIFVLPAAPQLEHKPASFVWLLWSVMLGSSIFIWWLSRRAITQHKTA